MQTLEYYGCDTTNNPVMWDVANYWGHYLESMSAVDKAYLLWELSDHYLVRVYPSQQVSADIGDYCDWLGDENHLYLDLNAQMALLRSLTNRLYCKPLGYWGLDYSHPMINYLYERYGEGLAGISTPDAYWIIATIGQNLCRMFYLSNGEEASEEAKRIRDAIANYLLPEDQLHALIQALGDS